MKNTIVIYYSNKGSNKYLAKKISKSLSCDIEEIKTRLGGFLLLASNLHFGIKPIKSDIEKYDNVILCGPVWMGKFIPPLKNFVKKYSSKVKSLIFVTCCGSFDSMKDEKFGYGLVFKEVESILHIKLNFCEAFPISLVLPEDKKEDSEATMKTRLSEENFKGEIQERFDNFIQRVN